MSLSILLPLLCFLFGHGLCCPPEEVIAPSCICKDLGDGPMMICSKLMSAEELIPPIKATDSMPMFALSIQDSSLLYIPSNIFHNTKFQKIQFVNSQIMSLSDTDVAFEGLEDSLEEIRAGGAHYITEWDWSQLQNLRCITLIDIFQISMYSVNQEFPHLKSLTSLGISEAEISFIHPTAFQGLEKLKLLILKKNDISEMSRSMLPDPANQLYLINLSGNQLSSLPNDMFSNMPALEEVNLNNNRFVTLDEDTFQSPFERLQTIELRDNPFRCDCRMRWLVQARKPMILDAVCSLPENLKGFALKYLGTKDLWC